MEYIELILWTGIVLILILKKDVEKHHRNTIEKVKTISIIMVSYYIIYTILGLKIGYSRSPYSQKIEEIIKNILFIVIVKVEQEYVRTKVLKYIDNTWYYIVVTLFYALFNIEYNIFNQEIITNGELIEYVLKRSYTSGSRIDIINILINKFRIYFESCIYNTKHISNNINSNFSKHRLVYTGCIRIFVMVNNISICKL